MRSEVATLAGRPVDAPQGSIAADSLAPLQVGQLMFPIAQRHVERAVLVDDAAIAEAQCRLWDRLRLVAEPGGATALAALISGAYTPRAGETVGVLVCGGLPTGCRRPERAGSSSNVLKPPLAAPAQARRSGSRR